MVKSQIFKFLGSIYTPDLNISNSLKIANTAVDVLGDNQDIVPSILPIPQDAPPDIPRIILSSPDKTLNINISLQRTNLFCEMPIDISSESINIEEYSNISSKFFSCFKKDLDLRVQRMAFVCDRADFREDALDYIQNRFCNKDQIKKGRPFSNPKRFEIHSLKKHDWESFHINSWVRLYFLSVKMKNANSNEPIIMVKNDINTLSIEEDAGSNFSEKNIKEFFEKAPSHIDDILQLYFK